MLLHRLLLLGVPWGQLVDASAGRGTFREIWRLQWQPEFSIKLAEALVYGPTIERAATGGACADIEKEQDCTVLAERVRQCLLADLPAAAQVCIRHLQRAAISAVHLTGLIASVSPLIDVLRYGSARKIPVVVLSRLVKHLTREVCVNLRYGCHSLDEDAAALMYRHIDQFDRSVSLLEDETTLGLWCRALQEMAADPQVPPLLRGCAERTLYDRQQRDEAETAKTLSRALAPAVPVAAAGAWLEGFLKQNGEILLVDDNLFALVDQWLCAIADDTFIELLPILRRALSGFDASSRQRLLERVHNDVQAVPEAVGLSADLEAAAAFAVAAPLLCTILGLPAETGEKR